MPLKIRCLLCKEELTSEEEQGYGTHYICSADFARRNVYNLSIADDSLSDSGSSYGTVHNTFKSTLVMLLFNTVVIFLFILVVIFNIPY